MDDPERNERKKFAKSNIFPSQSRFAERWREEMDVISVITTLILILIGSVYGNDQYDIQFEVIEETSRVTAFGQVIIQGLLFVPFLRLVEQD